MQSGTEKYKFELLQSAVGSMIFYCKASYLIKAGIK